MTKKSKFLVQLEYFSVRILIGITALMPRSLVYGMMKGVALLFYHLLKRRREVTYDNLRHAFPDMQKEGLQKLTREVYVELSITISDILLMLTARLDMDEMVENYEEALAKLEVLKSESHQGVIFMGAHFSNWELPPLFASKHGFPMTVIGRRGDNLLIDQKIVIPFRAKYGNQTAYKKKAGISMMRTLKRGGTVGLLIDQKVNKENGFLVSFFGREAFTTHAVAMMKRKSNPTIIPISMPRIAKGKYRLEIDDEIVYQADEVADEDEKLLKMTERYNQALEKIIKAHPAQWFWVHDRWNKRV
ncbi:MAG: hypothetical protein DRG30_08070 [Epsilonproteobacteria bacterium]|nr:MAG: hypothetical protein DRG30_08070 [Campylobacterota bacterium]